MAVSFACLKLESGSALTIALADAAPFALRTVVTLKKEKPTFIRHFVIYDFVYLK